MIKIDGELIMYTGCPQGLGPVALFWNIHFTDAMYFIFDHHWTQMWVIFVDDGGVHADCEERLDLRSNMFEAFCKVFKKPINTKFWPGGVRPPGTDSAVCAGIEFSAGGVQAPQHTVDALTYCLVEFQQKTLTDMQHVQGALNYTESVFKLDLDDRTRVGELKSIAFNRGTGLRYTQTPEAKQACLDLNDLIVNTDTPETRPEFKS